MEIISRALLITHIVFGFTSIALFWLPMLSKKGSNLHVKSGKLYVYAMWVVTGTAALLSVKNVILGHYTSAIFLGFLAVITSGPLWYAIAILNQKEVPTKIYKRRMLFFHSFVVVYSILMILYGLTSDHQLRILLFIFGGLGLTGLPDVVRYLRKIESKETWIQVHIIGMITTGIAAYTAFFVFGGQQIFGQIFKGYWVIILWVGPGVLGTFANIYFSRKYGPKPA